MEDRGSATAENWVQPNVPVARATELPERSAPTVFVCQRVQIVVCEPQRNLVGCQSSTATHERLHRQSCNMCAMAVQWELQNIHGLRIIMCLSFSLLSDSDSPTRFIEVALKLVELQNKGGSVVQI